MEPLEMGIAGGIVVVALGAFKLVEKFIPSKNSINNGTKVMDKQVDRIHEWYGPKGPMDRMTTQMEEMKDATNTQTNVLVSIKDALEKR